MKYEYKSFWATFAVSMMFVGIINVWAYHKGAPIDMIVNVTWDTIWQWAIPFAAIANLYENVKRLYKILNLRLTKPNIFKVEEKRQPKLRKVPQDEMIRQVRFEDTFD
jgi:hypothetical protein